HMDSTKVKGRFSWTVGARAEGPGRDAQASRCAVMRRAGAAALLVLACLAGNARAQVCTNGPLPEVSATIIPANGFPLYYVDSNGLALQPCLNLAGCGALAGTLPNPLAPISFPANFPPESFYARAVAKFTAGTVSGLYTAALEGTFFNGVVAAGNQMVFTRVRVINDTVTVGAIPISLLPSAFSLALAGPVGSTFLTWDTAPPAGFIGDGLTPHTITGSPCGTNFFQVNGPGLLPGSVQTNLFTITGQTINVCANGVLDVGEQCDDGNTLAGDCCSPTCKFEPLGSPCTAASVCTNNACNGAGACGFLSFNAIPCTDGNVCTVGDTCTLGACLGTPANCDDGKAATTGDSCSGGKCMGFISDAKLSLIAGENPSLAGFTAVADARTDGTSVRVSLTNMDPARFPVGCAGATITVGGISGTAAVTPFAAQATPLVRATALNFLTPGTVAAGSSAQIRLSCTVGAVVHSTRWSGVLAAAPPPPPAPCVPTTCAAQAKNCGTIPDGCGGTLTCGVCTAPQTCGGGGVANVCGVGAPAPATAALTLTATGRAGETVSSTPAGLSVPVGSTASATFPVGTSVSLGVTNGRSVIWSGACSSGGIKTPTCTFTLSAAASETASVQ
ncbi:MAG: hypothetical protein E6J56_05250, partial [Deltaproteobacteria bacterium]